MAIAPYGAPQPFGGVVVPPMHPGYGPPNAGAMRSMGPFLKVGFSVGAVAFFIGLWVVVATFTGKEPGEDCNSDGDCKGTNSVCLAAGSGAGKYCAPRCSTNADCPAADWTCETVGIIKIDPKGNQSKGGSDRVCALRSRSKRR